MKKVFITGIQGGIGKVVARSFKEAGYFVIGQDRLRGKPQHCDLYYQIDLLDFARDTSFREATIGQWRNDFDGLDALINNAATQKLGDTKGLTIEDWEETMSVNLTAPFLLIQAFYDYLADSKGSVVNITSIHHHLTKPRFVAYATSKSALVGLTKALAVDLKGKFRVNCISPAAVDTPMLHEGFDNDSSKVDQLGKLHPLQRIGKPEEVGRLALFLAQEGTNFINGANIMIDGGISSVLRDLE